MYKGEKVPSGTISFFTRGAVFEAEVKDGAYEIQGVPLGETKITVVRLDPNQPDPRASLLEARKQSAENKATRNDFAVVSDPARLQALQRKRHLLPYAYSSLNGTSLRFVVVAGPNSYDVRLVDPGKAD